MQQIYVQKKKPKKKLVPQVAQIIKNPNYKQAKMGNMALVNQMATTDNLNQNALKRLMQAPQTKPARPQTAKRP